MASMAADLAASYAGGGKLLDNAGFMVSLDDAEIASGSRVADVKMFPFQSV